MAKPAPLPPTSESDEVRAYQAALAKLAERGPELAAVRRRIRRLQRDVGMSVEESGQYQAAPARAVVMEQPDPFPSAVPIARPSRAR